MNGKLIIREGGREKLYEIVDEKVVIGNGQNADLRLRDESVSPLHCEITRTPRGFRVVDLETLPGTRVNGLTVNQHMLKDGDKIEIGATTLIYLGDSAREPSKPRKPVKQIPAELPKKADGRPQRFYRHETRTRRRSNPAAVAFVCVLIVAVGLTILMLSKSAYRSDAEERWNEILELVKKDSLASVEKAKRLLDAIPRTDLESADREWMEQKIKRALVELRRRDEARRAEERYAEIITTYRSGRENLAWLRNRVRAFEEDFPGTERAEELKRFLEKARYGTPENERRWREAREKILKGIRTKTFKPVFETLDALERDPTMKAAFGEHIDVLRASARKAFEGFYEVTLELALEAHAAGDADKARRLLETLAAVGLEPYATQARERLNTLR